MGYVWREGSLEEVTFELRLERSAGGREAFQANGTGFSGFLLEQNCGLLIFVSPVLYTVHVSMYVCMYHGG